MHDDLCKSFSQAQDANGSVSHLSIDASFEVYVITIINNLPSESKRSKHVDWSQQWPNGAYRWLVFIQWSCLMQLNLITLNSYVGLFVRSCDSIHCLFWYSYVDDILY